MITKKYAAVCEQALRHLLYHEETPFPPGTDWERIAAIMSEHRMESMFECTNDPALAALQRPESHFGHLLYRHILRQTMKMLFEEMGRRGIRGAVIKGTVLEDCYPPEVVRNSGDIDLFIPGCQREAICDMMRDMGIGLISDLHDAQCGVDVFHTPSNIELEVHYVIFRFFTARQRKLLREQGYFSEDCLVPYASDFSCFTLKPEAHLLYLLYHTAKHAMHHDLSYRMLTDLTLFVNRYGSVMDRDGFRRLADRLGMTRTINALLSYCIHHLGMRGDFWPDAGHKLDGLIRLSLASPVNHRWERLQRRLVWPFYLSPCVERDGNFYIIHYYRPAKALEQQKGLMTFVLWRIIRFIWGSEVDCSEEIA